MDGISENNTMESIIYRRKHNRIGRDTRFCPTAEGYLAATVISGKGRRNVEDSKYLSATRSPKVGIETLGHQ
jgi:hypothetical protein